HPCCALIYPHISVSLRFNVISDDIQTAGPLKFYLRQFMQYWYASICPSRNLIFPFNSSIFFCAASYSSRTLLATSSDSLAYARKHSHSRFNDSAMSTLFSFSLQTSCIYKVLPISQVQI